MKEETTRVTHSKWIRMPPSRRFPKINWVHQLPQGLVFWLCNGLLKTFGSFCVLCKVKGGVAFLKEVRPDPTLVFRASGHPTA